MTSKNQEGASCSRLYYRWNLKDENGLVKWMILNPEKECMLQRALQLHANICKACWLKKEIILSSVQIHAQLMIEL